jgi:hypothetical protein
MRKPGSEGAPSDKDLKVSRTEDVMARHASHKIVRVKKGSNFIYRKMTEVKEPTSAFVTPNHKHPTGKTAYGKMSNKELRDRLSNTVKTSANESQ